MKTTSHIETISLFPELNYKLIELLKNLSEAEWRHPTRFSNWKIKDIVAHLLDTSIRRLSSQRDNYNSEITVSISSYNELIQYITNLADKWASAFTIVSPNVLIELVEEYQTQLYEFFIKLDPFDIAHFSVAWAGEEKSYNWFDIAREYTERWHHQMQIRDTLGKTPLYDKHLYYPLLDTFMQALPCHFKSINKNEGYSLCVHITNESGGKWFLMKNNNSWELMYDINREPDTTIIIDNSIAWKIFIKWIDEKNMNDKVQIIGDEFLGKHLLNMTCIII